MLCCYKLCSDVVKTEKLKPRETMEIKYLAIALIIFLIIYLRIMYTKGLVDDWNHYLNIYLHSNYYYEEAEFIGINYFLEYKLKLGKYWWRFDCWTIDSMVDDKMLIRDVNIIKQTHIK